MTQKLALVTGGLHRVGAAIAARLAREGYALALHRHNPAEVDAVLVEALAETGADSRHFAADLSDPAAVEALVRSEEHTSELQSLMRISYAVFCLKKKKTKRHQLRLHQ